MTDGNKAVAVARQNSDLLLNQSDELRALHCQSPCAASYSTRLHHVAVVDLISLLGHLASDHTDLFYQFWREVQSPRRSLSWDDNLEPTKFLEGEFRLELDETG
jgi:hypothetical protein